MSAKHNHPTYKECRKQAPLDNGALVAYSEGYNGKPCAYDEPSNEWAAWWAGHDVARVNRAHSALGDPFGMAK